MNCEMLLLKLEGGKGFVIIDRFLTIHVKQPPCR